MEQQDAAGGAERQVAELVDDQELWLGEEGEVPAVGMVLGERRHEGGRGGEERRVVLPDRLAAEGDREMIAYLCGSLKAVDPASRADLRRQPTYAAV